MKVKSCRSEIGAFLTASILSVSENDTGLLSAHLFKQYVVPELKKVFCVHETAIRLALLQYFDRYCLAFDEATLKDLILPEVSVVCFLLVHSRHSLSVSAAPRYERFGRDHSGCEYAMFGRPCPIVGR